MDEQRLTAEERQDLVAYLDGELEERAAARLETKLANSATARRELDSLKRTWEVLDFLPMPEATADFTHRTAELLTVQDQRRAIASRSAVDLLRNVSVFAAWLLGVVACFAGGWLAVTRWPDANEGLVRDLPVIERLEDYRAIRDVDFLRLLHERRVLDEIDKDFELTPPVVPEQPAPKGNVQ
jgi:hypothetical protein